MYWCYVILLLVGVDVGKTTFTSSFHDATSHVAPGAIDIQTDKTKFLKTDKPLKFFTPFTEFFEVNNTGTSVDIFRITQRNVGLAGSVSGGTLGDDIYIYFKFKFYFNPKGSGSGIHSYTVIDGKGTGLEALVFYYNKNKYGSVENATKYPDGIVIVTCQIKVVDKALPNALFTPFSLVLQAIPTPGKHICAAASFTYCWYILFPPHTSYYTYRSKFTDADTKDTYIATVIAIQSLPANYISLSQFYHTFGKIKDSSGKQLQNVAKIYPQGATSVTLSEGVIVIYVPG